MIWSLCGECVKRAFQKQLLNENREVDHDNSSLQHIEQEKRSI